ncbi:cupin domain-containing protein [Mariniphaga sediminis]|jgi:transcriptional regulator with XRE-family HTH domain|uniref:Cupin domain-containing protein n=1 Tax=Mariniphaga sediminis TaxID=1628158 RepID=A0A399D6U8_9BACT|nr:XRE family transcriptional regulator [Mariniphaga sediminis]MBD3620741.1 helix-turn-helix transcriptional regulator [Sunxiuqinia sp.]RIH67267.1 cupin domain-containing protein [Mariniphaga sediminis]
MKRLGERIKRKRESLHMQLNELARKVGISSSALSQIEKAKAFPSVLTLKSIADSLYTTVGELIGENEILTKNPLVKFNKKSFVERNDSGATLYLLSNHGNGKQMETFLVEFEKGASSEGIMKIHPGQEFCFVLNGKIEFTLDDKSYILEKHDSFYFNSASHHLARNISQGNSQVIWIITPPEG